MTISERNQTILSKPSTRLLMFAILVCGFLAGSELVRSATWVPLPVYEIEAESNGHRASLLNLRLGQPGVPQVPMPVDVDGDLLPDVLVAVNLVDPDGLVQNPPNPGDVFAPNIRITRLHLPTTVLGKPSPPLKINVRLTLRDAEGREPDTIVRFGYDTGRNGTLGSIPPDFKAIILGLTGGFNPLSAEVSTVGFEGPLALVGGLEQGARNAKLDFGYRPWPGTIGMRYENEECGATCTEHHVTYEHKVTTDVDLDAAISFTDGVTTSEATARIDRLPGRIGFDLRHSDEGGRAKYASPGANGRLPDIGLTVATRKAGARPLIADAQIEGLPATMEAEWSFPPGGDARAAFKSSGAGIGAIDVDVRDYETAQAMGAPYVPDQRQFLSFQRATGGAFGSESRIRGRLERIREASFAQAGDGMNATVKIGDGEQPLRLHFRDDSRSQPAGTFVEIKGLVAPLPDSLGVSFDAPSTTPTEADPLRVRYEASSSVDVTADLVVRDAGAPEDCARRRNLCATLKAMHIPPEIEARIVNIGAGASNPAELRAAIDMASPFSTARPDFFADVIVGQEEPCAPPSLGCERDGRPIVAHAELLGFPRHVRIRAVEGENETVQRVEFHACDWNFDAATPACAGGSESPIGSLAFSVRNFVERAGTGVPPAAPETPLYATIVARGQDDGDVLFEATGKVTDISEIQYLQKDVTGIRTKIGAGKDFSAHVDIRNVDVGSDTIGKVDVLADTRVTPLPATFDLCYRRSGLNLVSQPSSPYTAPCEVSQPFDGLTLSESPTSFAYRSATPFDVEAKARVRFHDILPAESIALDGGSPTSVPRDDQFISGYLKLANVPASLTTHVLVPKATDTGGKEGPIRVLHDAPGATQCDSLPCPSQLNIEFAAELTDGDLSCEDARTAPPKRKALCLSGRLENLPTKVDLRYDPSVATNNLSLDTEGDKKMDFRDLRLSLVERLKNGSGVFTTKPRVLVAEGEVLGIPRDVRGTIDVPDTIDVSASPSGDPAAKIDRIRATVRNFIVPDPMPSAEPTRTIERPFLPPLVIGPSDPIQKVLFFGRHDADLDMLLFKAIADIRDVVGFGYATAQDASGNPLDTKHVRVDFGQNSTIRAYADLDLGTSQLTADVVLPDTPAGISLCFRGPRTTTGDPVAPRFCDTAPKNNKQGAFSFVQRPNPPVGELDVHAYLRYATGGGADVLSARADIINIPRVVQGTFGNGTADVGGFESVDENGVGINRDGIDVIGFHLASFDIADHGYADPPFDPRVVAREPFPAVATSRQHVGLAADDADFEARGRIGAIEGTGVPGSDLQRVLVSDVPCRRPANAGARPDFPFYPPNSGTSPVFSYTCVRVEFEQVGGDVDPLDLNAVILRDGKRIALRDAGLTEIPSFVQLNLTQTDVLDRTNPTDPLRPFRPLCKAAAPSTFPTQDPSADCMPPLVRFDTPGNSVLYGVLEMGDPSDLAALGGVPERLPMADPDAAPGEGGCGWGDWGACNPTNPTAGPKGIRVKAGTHGDIGNFDVGDPSAMAIRAGIRLLVPPSLTVEQVRSWSYGERDSVPDHYWTASDLRFLATIRNPDGSIVTSLGEMTALLHAFDTGDQMAVSDENPLRGFTIPGQIGLGVFSRDNKGKGRNLIQIDGRLSAPISIRARMVSDAGTNLDAKVLNIPATQPGDGPEDPSFRLRAEILGEPASTVPPPPQGSPGGGGPAGDPPEEETCSILYCLITQVRLERVAALFDFAPNQSSPARLIEAAIRSNGTKNGFQMKAWDRITGGNPTGVTARGDVLVRPINVFLHAGIPIIGSLDFMLLSDLAAGLRVENASDFVIRHNLLHATASSNGPAFGGGAITWPCLGFSCVYVDYRIYQLHGIAFSIVGLLWGNPVLLGVDYFPPSVPRDLLGFPTADPTGITGNVPVQFRSCHTLGTLGTQNLLPIVPGTDVVIWPDLGNLHFYGTLAPLFEGIKFISKFVAPVFCLFPAGPADVPLIEGSAPGAADRIPGDAIGIAGHPVPGVAAATTFATAPATQTPKPLIVSANTAICGDRLFNSLWVQSGATLSVATAADSSDLFSPDGANLGDKCPAGQEGRLQVTATGTEPSDPRNGDVVIDGVVVAANGTPASPDADTIDPEPSYRLSLTAIDITVNGAITGRRGKVRLAAANNLSVPGTVRADGVWSSPPFGGTTAVGNGGGGHGGAGGNGSTGVGGAAYGNTSFSPVEAVVQTEGGSPGGGPSAGAGGGNITLLGGRSVAIGGAVSANGSAGATDASGHCDPDNNGAPGNGGGAGGGIVIAAPSVSVGGTLEAVGGSGGDGRRGGGGGGAGGRIKVKAPLFSGSAGTGGGGAGASLCPEFGAGAGGSSGSFQRNTTAYSSALASNQFWKRGTPVPVGYSAAAGVVSGSNDFDIVLCGIFISSDRPDQDLDGDTKPDGLQKSFPTPVPGSATVSDPCGNTTLGNPQPAQLGQRTLTNTTQSATGDTIAATLPTSGGGANGFWGVWTTVLKSDTDGNSCLAHTGPFELLFDALHCQLEPFPETPETVFGVDNNRPEFTLATNVTLTNPDGLLITGGRNITLTVSNERDVMAGSFPPEPDPLSGIKNIRCGAGSSFVDCGPGAIPFVLPSSEGKHDVSVVAFDQAGNASNNPVIPIVLDRTPPSSSGAIAAPLPAGVVALKNNWYSASPWFVLSGLSDPGYAGGVKGAGFGHYEYRFDEGATRTCTANPCVIGDSPGEDLPGPGRHTLTWVAVDKVGNRSAERTIAVKIDGELPLTALSTSPSSPDGANGWFVRRTFAAISAFDLPPGGSGLRNVPSDGNTWMGFGLFYGLDGPATTPYTGFFEIPRGEHTVCWKAIDVAGNESAEQCSGPIRVDHNDPDVSIQPTPAAPNGDNGWYVTEPVVRITTTDPAPGSTVNPLHDPDLTDLCTGRPLRVDPGETIPSGTCVSVDGAAYSPYFGTPIVVREGLHSIRAFAFDVAGRRGEIREKLFLVDLSRPVTPLRLKPPEPAQAGWYRSRPFAVLRSTDGDQNAGVKDILAALGSAPLAPYADPIRIPEGENVLTWRARDHSGPANNEGQSTFGVNVDVTRPTAKALSPDPAIWVRPLSTPFVDLHWEISDNLSRGVRVIVIVYDVTQRVVARIDDGVKIVEPGKPLRGSTKWNGVDTVEVGSTSLPLVAGGYFYRVIAIDEAGNSAQSGESHPLTINVAGTGLTPPSTGCVVRSTGQVITRCELDFVGPYLMVAGANATTDPFRVRVYRLEGDRQIELLSCSGGSACIGRITTEQKPVKLYCELRNAKLGAAMCTSSMVGTT